MPEESIRLMVQDEAVNDFRALCLLESFLGRERVMELIRQEAGMELSFKTYPRNGEFILGLREKVNSLLESPWRIPPLPSAAGDKSCARSESSCSF